MPEERGKYALRLLEFTGGCTLPGSGAGLIRGTRVFGAAGGLAEPQMHRQRGLASTGGNQQETGGGYGGIHAGCE